MQREINSAEKLRETRLDMGWSQQRLADETGISNKTISAYELGTLSLNLQPIKKLAKALGKPVSYFTEKGSPDYLIESKLRNIEIQLEEVKKLIEKNKY